MRDLLAKPLCVACGRALFVFASELKAFFVHPMVERRAIEQRSTITSFCHVPDPAMIYSVAVLARHMTLVRGHRRPRRPILAPHLSARRNR